MGTHGVHTECLYKHGKIQSNLATAFRTRAGPPTPLLAHTQPKNEGIRAKIRFWHRPGTRSGGSGYPVGAP